MEKPKTSRLNNEMREWIRLHSVAAGVTLTTLVVVSGLLGLFILNGRFSPSDLETGNGTTVQLRITDHDNQPQARLLINSLTDNSQTPEFVSSQIMEIPRNNDGTIPSLFRIQGSLIYR